MILQTVQMLTQEPWCLTPAAIADLTDWQIEHLYARPAIERAEQVKRLQAGHEVAAAAATEPHHPERPPDPTAPEFRGWVVAQFMRMGLSRAAAEKRYDDQQFSRR